MRRLAPLLLIGLLVIGACDSVEPSTTTMDGSGTAAPDTTEASDTTDTTAVADTTAASDTTAAPGTTAAPDTTEVPDETDDERETPWWVLIIVGIGLVLIVSILTRRGSRQTTATTRPLTWKDNARRGYAEARWLYDALDEDMAVWRGNATFDRTADVGATAATSRAETWKELPRRQNDASNALYALEAAAPDGRTAEAARRVISTMRTTREMVDARAEARFAYRTAEAAGVTPNELIEARDREVRSSRNLAEARNAYAKALTDLSALV